MRNINLHTNIAHYITEEVSSWVVGKPHCLTTSVPYITKPLPVFKQTLRQINIILYSRGCVYLALPQVNTLPCRTDSPIFDCGGTCGLSTGARSWLSCKGTAPSSKSTSDNASQRWIALSFPDHAEEGCLWEFANIGK